MVNSLKENTVLFSFEKLDVYKLARQLVKDVYCLQKKFPHEERFELGDQIRRAVTSVTSNIAEGCGRNSYKEKVHFVEIACGSLFETFSQLQNAQDLGYISEHEVEALRVQFITIGKKLSGLKASYEVQINDKPLNIQK